jgi:hypothetical protein
VLLLLPLAGCQLAEPYLVPRKSIELLTSLPADARAHAQVPALHESDRRPVLIDYRALQLSDSELAAVAAQPGRAYRLRAAQRSPLLLVGGVILGMALPHVALGLAVGLDKPPGVDGPAITDSRGGVVAMAAAGLHLVVGAVLMGIGAQQPRVEPAPAELLEQYQPQARSP